MASGSWRLKYLATHNTKGNAILASDVDSNQDFVIAKTKTKERRTAFPSFARIFTCRLDSYHRSTSIDMSAPKTFHAADK